MTPGIRWQTAPSRASGFEGFDFSTRGVDYSASFGDLFAEVLTERGARQPSAQRGADLHHGDAGHVRGVAFGRPAGDDGDASRSLPRMRGQWTHAVEHGLLSFVPGHRRRALRARPHGLLAQLRRVRRNGPAAAACVRAVRGKRTGNAQRDACRPASRRASPMAIGFACRARATPASAAVLPATCMSRCRWRSHPVFRREGDDLHMTVPIAVHEAALGARVEIRTLEGTARLRVPPGTQSGQRFRLREHGAPSTRNGQRGDLIVEVRIMLPRLLDERSKELLREFGRINGETVRE